MKIRLPLVNILSDSGWQMVLRYPYYDTTVVSTNTPLAQITAVDLAKMATSQHSEIVIMPVPMQDIYVQFTNGPISAHLLIMMIADDISHSKLKSSAMILFLRY